MLHPRARTMLLLSLPAVAIGIASSLILIVVMKIASVLQNLLWQRLPGTLGIAQETVIAAVTAGTCSCSITPNATPTNTAGKI
ncbi:hypothetical protein ACUOFC_18795, partial [Escherichia sp. TWPC-MK]